MDSLLITLSLAMWIVTVLYVVTWLVRRRRLSPKPKRPTWVEERRDEIERERREKEELRVNLTLLEFGVDPSAIITAEDVALREGSPAIPPAPEGIVRAPAEIPPRRWKNGRDVPGGVFVKITDDGWYEEVLKKPRPVDPPLELNEVKCGPGVHLEVEVDGGTQVRETMQHRSCEYHYPKESKQPVLKKDWDRYSIGGAQ